MGSAYVKPRKAYRQTLLQKSPRSYTHKARTNRWNDFKKALEEEKWDEDSEASIEFVDTYFVFPRVVHALEKVILSRWKEKKLINRYNTITGTSFPIGDLILIAIKWLRGVQVPDIAESFGRRLNSTRSALNIAFDALYSFDYVFGKNVGTLETVDEIKSRLKEKGVPWPEIPYVADCTDIGIWTSDDVYYTYKRCCPSTKAIRVLLTLRRDTYAPVDITFGGAPSGPMGQDTQMLLSSEFSAYARATGTEFG